MATVLELLSHVTTPLPARPGISSATLMAAKAGDAAATISVLQVAEDFADDEDFFVDDIARLSGNGLDEFVRQDPLAAARLLGRMDTHLTQINWGRRSFDYYNIPLQWIHQVAVSAAGAGLWDLLEDAAAVMFRHEPDLDRWPQKDRTTAWLTSLEGPAATHVARVLREHPQAARYYGPVRTTDGAIHAALLAANGRD
jgi:hypothetical protein